MAKSLRGYVGSVAKISREFDENSLKKVILLMLTKTKDELLLVAKDPKATCLEHCIGAIIARSIKDGDIYRLNFLLDRAIGKVTENVKIDSTPNIQYITEINADGNLIQSVINEAPKMINVTKDKKHE